MIETIDSEKLANNVNKAWAKIEKPDKAPLKVFLQINTSGEEGKLKLCVIFMFSG